MVRGIGYWIELAGRSDAEFAQTLIDNLSGYTGYAAIEDDLATIEALLKAIRVVLR
jgi:hypothetical protein